MTAPPWPAKTLGDVVGVITANATGDVRADFLAALDQAWTSAVAEGTLEPLLALVEGWWPQAVFWADRDAAMQVMARVAEIEANGLPADRPRFGREELLALIEARRAQE